jgi:hypothetical protein
MILAAYAKAVARGKVDPAEEVSLGALERWYWPGTDGAAHLNAIQDWKDRQVLRADGRSAQLPLDEVVWAMIRWSDNAATDYLLRRLGGSRTIRSAATALGLTTQDPPASIFGAFVVWATMPPEEWLRLRPTQQVAVANRVAKGTSASQVETLLPASVEVQAELAEVTWLGSPRAWANFFAELYREVAEDSGAGEVVNRHLEWPMTFEGNRVTMEAFGTKGGSLPGVLTEASYIDPRGEKPLSIALFFRDLEARAQRSLQRNFMHQRLMTNLAVDPDFLALACAQLANRSTASGKG